MIEKILNTINNTSPQSLEEKIITDLRKNGNNSIDQNNLVERILHVIKITKDKKTRESLIRSYFRTYLKGIDKDGRDSSVTIEITKRCNKNCDYCYSNSHNKTKEISDQILNKIVDFAKEEYKHIFLTGGEPTLDNRVFSLAENNPDIMFFMFTNGSTITEEYAKAVSKFGNVIPMLAVDGSTKHIHDSLRGSGSYDEVNKAIDNLNNHNVSWGYIGMVTNQNAKDILNQKFVKNMSKKGAFIARYLEYLPVGPCARKKFILTGENYYHLEKRKKEIIESGDIYIQETIQKKCTGLLSFDVDGNIKKCPFFHYSKYNLSDGNISKLVKETVKNWMSYDYQGECPLYSDPVGFKNHLEKLGWKHSLNMDEEYLCNPDISQQMMRSYKRFLDIKSNNGVI